MLIEVNCPQCGKHLKAPENMAGKQAKCPGCKNTIQLPHAAAATPAPATAPAPKSAPQQTVGGAAVSDASWRMATPDGQEYGPVAKRELDQWVTDGRLDEHCQIYHEGWTQWKQASEVYPQLRPRTPAPQPATAPAPQLDLGFAAPARPDAGIGDFASAAPPGPPPRSRGTARAAVAPPTVDALPWLPVKIGIGLSQLACLVLAIAIGGLLLSAILEHVQRSSPSATSARLAVLLKVFGAVSAQAAAYALVIGWFISRGTPRDARAGGALLGSLVGVVAFVALLAIVVLIPIFATSRPSNAVLRTLETLVNMAFAGGLICNAFYLGLLGAYFRRATTFTLAIVCVVLDGIWFVWQVLDTFVINPDSDTVRLLVALVPLALLLADMVLRQLMNSGVRTALRQSARI